MSDSGRGSLDLIPAFVLGDAAGGLDRVPGVVGEAYSRAAQAAREAFVRALEEAAGPGGAAR